MTRPWRSLGFVPLALLLVLLVHDLSVRNRVVPGEQVGKTSAKQSSNVTPSAKKVERLLAGHVTEIPLYEGGDLAARKPAKKKVAKLEPLPKTKPLPAKRVRKPAQPQAMTVAKVQAPETGPRGSDDAVRPVLVASYDRIGFGRYLKEIERVGRFFILMREEGGTKIGPPVSLARRMTLPRSQSLIKILVVERPHLVSDRDVGLRLRQMNLPTNAYSDRVALLFKVSFDRALWLAVGKALRHEKLALRHVEEVRGHYVLRSGRVYLEFDSATLKQDQGSVLLNDAIKVRM
jgi:hypothetical protein